MSSWPNHLEKQSCLDPSSKMISTKKRSDEHWDNFKKQINLYVKLLCQTKEKYFSDINVKSISDNKKFWKNLKPFFFKKG